MAIAADYLGFTIISLDEVTSTNDLAREYAKNNCQAGFVITAKRQTKGRGRRGRSWHSESGGLYFSILLKPDLPPAQVSLLTLTAGAAVVEVLREYYQLPAELKWPNDVLVTGKKVAGILCEGLFHNTDSFAVIVGIGVNTNQPLAGLPEEIQAAAASLSTLTGVPVDNDLLLRQILARFHNCYQTVLSGCGCLILDRVKQYTSMLGKIVNVTTETTVFTAKACDINEHGALIVERQDGSREAIWAADVSIRLMKGED